MNKPNSKRGQVRAHFLAHGADKAVDFGATLGIGEAKVRRWAKRWASPAVQPSNKRRVRVVGTSMMGTLTQTGSQQSEVKLDAGWHQVFVNERLEEIHHA